LPIVHGHLAKLDKGVVPESVLRNLKDSVLQVVMRNLAMIAIHRRLVREVFEPLGVPFLFFKGPSLAYRYYQEPARRQYRDIDVLVPRADLVRLGKRMREQGFGAYPHTLWGTDDALKFRQRFVGMMDWVAP